MHRISGWPDICLFFISGIQPDILLTCWISGQISGEAGYRMSG
jgi:hypothetical protein